MKAITNILTISVLILTMVITSKAQSKNTRKASSNNAYFKEAFTIRDSVKVSGQHYKLNKRKKKPTNIALADGSVRFSKSRENSGSPLTKIVSKERRNRNPPSGKVIQLAVKNNIKVKPGKELVSSIKK